MSASTSPRSPRRPDRRRWLLESAGALGSASIAMLGAPRLARAANADFPQRPVTLVVPFAPGGNLDVVARAVAVPLQRELGQPVVVENRAGAGGAIGATAVARAEHDGHALLVTTPNALVVLPHLARTNYSLKDFEPVAQLTTTPLVIVVQGSGPYKDMKSLMSAIKGKPGTVSAGHSGPGTTNHVAMLQLEEAAGIDLNEVAYKGSGPALIDLMGGQIDMAIDQLTSSAGHLKSGMLRALAVLSARRDPALPDVPSLAELGVADLDASTRTGLMAPAGTPGAVIERLQAALSQAMTDGPLQQQLGAVGSPPSLSSAEAWGKLLRDEARRAEGMARAGKLKPA